MASAFKKVKELFKGKKKGRNEQFQREDEEDKEIYGATVSFPDPWEINPADLKLTRKIKDHGLTEIHEGVLKSNHGSTETRVVAKLMKAKMSAADIRSMLSELLILKTVNTYHVVKLLGVITLPDPVCVIREFMAHGNLLHFLRSHNPDFKEYDERRQLSFNQMLQMCGEIADGMAYLSDKCLVHKDLAARNCRVSEDLTVKVGGLWMSERSDTDDYHKTHEGRLLPIRWMAPESLLNGVFSSKSDMWSYGILLWEIATLGRQPYPGLSNEEVVRKVTSGKTMDIPKRANNEMIILMKKCWSFKASERPSFPDIIETMEPDLNRNFQRVSYFHSEKRKVPDNFVHDPYALELYRRALTEGTEKDRSIRINVVGNFGQGKTSLVRRLIGETVDDVHSTNGIDIERYCCRKEKNGTLSYIRKENINDSEISDRLALVASTAYIHFGDTTINNQNMLEQLDDKESEIAVVQDSKDGKYTLDRNQVQIKTFQFAKGNKLPASDSIVKLKTQMHLIGEDFRLFQKKLENYISKVPEDTNAPICFDLWDFGGQFSFYATHTIFHSKRAIYLLVFDLSRSLQECLKENDENEDLLVFSRESNMAHYIRFWMNSVHAFVGNDIGTEPPVFLVGTHKDKLLGDEQSKQRYVDKYFSDIRDMFDETLVINHVMSEDFAVDNTNKTDNSIQKLREAILKLGEKMSKSIIIPAKWIQLEKVLVRNRNEKITSMKKVLEIDKENEFPIGDIEQIKLFLKFHHNKGTFCYFDEEPISDVVVLDPQYLIDAFKCIITSGRFCKKDRELRTFWQKLLKEAKLENTLIDRVWGSDKDKEFMKHKNTLIAFLKKHHIISEAMAYDPTTRTCEGLGWYLVPSFLKNHCSESEVKGYLHGKQQTLTRCVLTFTNNSTAVVPTIYHRVIAATLGRWPFAQFKGENLIFENLSVFRLREFHDGVVEINENNIELFLVSLRPSVPVIPEVADALRRFVDSVVIHELGKLRDISEKVEKPFVTNFRCNHASHGLSGSSKLIQMHELNDEKILPCPDSLSHEIKIERILEEWFQHGKSPRNIPKLPLALTSLSKISAAVGSNWELLGIELGLSRVEIQHITADYPNSVVMRIYKMLTRWNDKETVNATMDVLVQAMHNCPEVSVDWDIVRNVMDELSENKA